MSRRRSLSPDLEEFATLLLPEDAEPPILAPAVRALMRQWLVEINSGEELKTVGVAARKRALLYGPPGCGKTTLAHHLAVRLGMPLVVVDMAAMVDKYLGGTGRNIRALFAAMAPLAETHVLLLDEFDGLAVRRMRADQSATQERNHSTAVLLSALDCYGGVTLAATNRDDDIDGAVWRRFDMQIAIVMPDEAERFAILRRYLAPLALADEAVQLLAGDVLAGASPAVLRALMEGLKRDFVIAPKCGLPADARATFERLKTSVRPHPDLEQPALWKTAGALDWIAEIAWPPRREEREKAA